MGENVGLLAAAAAGLLSFLSPCVLPLIPGYISFVSGISLEDLRKTASTRQLLLRAFAGSFWFVAGFSLVFIALGASATAMGRLLLERMALLRQAAGIVIILFGLHLVGLFRIPFLQVEKRVEVRQRPMTAIGALLVGGAFAFGWTPCLGPILAGILALAATRETVLQGMLLLAVYSLALGIPFLATSVLVPLFFRIFGRLRRYLRIFEAASGLLLVAVGLLILTNRLTVLAGWAQRLPFFNRFAL